MDFALPIIQEVDRVVECLWVGRRIQLGWEDPWESCGAGAVSKYPDFAAQKFTVLNFGLFSCVHSW